MTGWDEHGAMVAGVSALPVAMPPRPLQPDESLHQLLARVGRSLGVSWEELKGPSRIKHVAGARKIAMAEAQTAGYSSVAIGAALGGRHHSTVLHGIKSLHALKGQRRRRYRPAMPRRNSNANDGHRHSRSGAGWMHKGKRKKKGGGSAGDRAPLTPGAMHSKTRLR